MSIEQALQSRSTIVIRQLRELAEVFGLETRNKYSIESEDGQQLGYAAEQQKGILGFFMRQTFGHWRTYDLNIYGPQRNLEFVAHHPFRFYYQRLELRSTTGEYLGRLERKFEVFGKHFDLLDENDRIIMSVHSPLWRIWTFSFKQNESELAEVKKQWGGLANEVFLDADTFKLKYISNFLTEKQKLLLLVAGLFIDLRYFEKRSAGRFSMLDLFSN